MSSMDGRWTFNETEDGLWWHEDFETKEEAIEEAKIYLCEDQEEMYIGQCETVPLPNYIDIDDIFEQLNEHYSEDCFEYDDYIFEGVGKEDREWLETKLQNLMNEFYEKTGIKSTQYTMVNIEKISL
jgi:hypothetical protein